MKLSLSKKKYSKVMKDHWDLNILVLCDLLCSGRSSCVFNWDLGSEMKERCNEGKFK